MDRLKRDGGGGYLVVSEFSRAPVSSYIWGPPVRKVFETMRAGYSLSTALHAPSVDDAYAAICRTNGVPDEDASRLTYMIYIERMGDDEDSFWRRIAQVHEVDRVVGGRPQGRVLYFWQEQDDKFEQVEEPRRLAVDSDRLRERARRLTDLASSGRTSVEDVQSVVAGSQR